ncbi:hypothetical protein C8J56DRAFT_1043116 [Mycena floridula]|nr:hypothetical protein C8J56DRAFT_1043116 [Mycena floridula]
MVVGIHSRACQKASLNKSKALICLSVKRNGFSKDQLFIHESQTYGCPALTQPEQSGLQKMTSGTDAICYSTEIPKDVIDHLQKSAFITLGSDNCYFIKHNDGGWNAILPDKHLQNVTELKPHVENFDRAIRGETQDDPEHPLTKVLTEFDKGWCLEPGSTLCPYSDRYFFLKFKKPNDNVIRMRWSLPDLMSQKFAELKELAQSPEDQAFLAQEQMAEMKRQETNAALAIQRMNMQMNLNNMMNQTLINGGNSIKMASGGYVEMEMTYCSVILGVQPVPES